VTDLRRRLDRCAAALAARFGCGLGPLPLIEACRFVFDRSLEARKGRRFSPRATVPPESDLVPSESVQSNYGPIGVDLGKLIGKIGQSGLFLLYLGKAAGRLWL
jgi:hypothetical protein